MSPLKLVYGLRLGQPAGIMKNRTGMVMSDEWRVMRQKQKLGAGPGGKMPPSTAGGTPAATLARDNCRHPAGRNARDTADKNVCATVSALPYVAGQKSSALSVGRTLFPPGGTPGSTAGGTPAATCAALRPPPKAHSFTFSAFSAVKHPRFRFLDFLDLCVPGIP
jgi:hypothetical protein